MSDPTFTDNTTEELCTKLVPMRKKLSNIEKNPGTRSTMLAAATATYVRNLEAEIARRPDLEQTQRRLNTTKEGVLVEPGQIWRDRDKRMSGRLVKILAVEYGIATVQSPSGGTRTRISVARMRPISTGFDLVSYGSA